MESPACFAIPTAEVHGLNERLPVKSLFEGQEFLYRLVKALASGE